MISPPSRLLRLRVSTIGKVGGQFCLRESLRLAGGYFCSPPLKKLRADGKGGYQPFAPQGNRMKLLPGRTVVLPLGLLDQKPSL